MCQRSPGEKHSVCKVLAVETPAAHAGASATRCAATTEHSPHAMAGFATKLSSAGLVYKHFGREVVASLMGIPETHADVDTVYLKVYASFMEALDAIDNGEGHASSLGASACPLVQPDHHAKATSPPVLQSPWQHASQSAHAPSSPGPVLLQPAHGVTGHEMPRAPYIAGTCHRSGYASSTGPVCRHERAHPAWSALRRGYVTGSCRGLQRRRQPVRHGPAAALCERHRPVVARGLAQPALERRRERGRDRRGLCAGGQAHRARVCGCGGLHQQGAAHCVDGFPGAGGCAAPDATASRRCQDKVLLVHNRAASAACWAPCPVILQVTGYA